MKTGCAILLFAALIGETTCLFWRDYIYVDQDMTWYDARAYCQKNYAELATIVSEEEFSLFKTHAMTRNKWCWIGLSKTPGTTVYKQWSDGRVLRHHNWEHDQPDNVNNYDCVFAKEGKWYDYYCPSPLNFFCYTWKPELIVVQEMKTWDEALEHCRTFYTDMISLTTEKDLFVANNNSRHVQTPSFWIGLHFLDGSWFWVNGEPLRDGNLVSMSSCPARPFLCGAKPSEADIWENRDCNEKMNFMCYKTE